MTASSRIISLCYLDIIYLYSTYQYCDSPIEEGSDPCPMFLIETVAAPRAVWFIFTSVSKGSQGGKDRRPLEMVRESCNLLVMPTQERLPVSQSPVPGATRHNEKKKTFHCDKFNQGLLTRTPGRITEWAIEKIQKGIGN